MITCLLLCWYNILPSICSCIIPNGLRSVKLIRFQDAFLEGTVKKYLLFCIVSHIMKHVLKRQMYVAERQMKGAEKQK